MQLQKLERKDIEKLLPYFRNQGTHISNYSAGSLFMWNKYLSTMYAEEEGCLVLCDRYVGNRYFYWPLSKDGDAAAEERVAEKIEKFCRENYIRLHFTAVPRERLSGLVLRYGSEVHVSDIRKWRDYLYNAQDFIQYPGGKYSGQRNHVNKFKKNNPDYTFARYTVADRSETEAFLREIAKVQTEKEETLAAEEMRGVFEILPKMEELGLFGGILRAGGEMVAFSVGEYCGDMLVVHIEKAKRGVAGAYPTVAQLFAKEYCNERTKYINREDDSGDAGLRKSKLQYLPVQVVDKYNLAVRRTFDAVSDYPHIKTLRLELKGIADEDASDFARLARDEELNRYWGYDWRENATEENPADAWFLQDVRKDFKQKNELPLGIYFEGKLAGEVVLHNFGYQSEAEIGMRILPEWQGRGFARESLIAMMEYGFMKLSLEKIEAKCYKENTVSAYTLKAAGMRPCGEDDKYYYFYKTPSM